MIDKKVIKKYAPELVDEQVHVNHEGCSMGEDRKRRLYIRRVSNGIVAYCHHCSEKGFVSEDSEFNWLHKPTKIFTKKPKLPILGDMSARSIFWLSNYFCDPDDSKHFCGISKDMDRLALCLKNINGDLIGYQIRNLSKSKPNPKYITQYFDDKDVGECAWFVNEDKMSSTLVLTEDYLSAYRVNKDTGYTSVALLGTTLKDKLLIQIAELGFTAVIVWLDFDEAGTKGAEKAMKKLTYYLPSSTKILFYNTDKEPKELRPRELQNQLL